MYSNKLLEILSKERYKENLKQVKEYHNKKHTFSNNNYNWYIIERSSWNQESLLYNTLEIQQVKKQLKSELFFGTIG